MNSSTVTAQFKAKKLGRNLYLQAQVGEQIYTWSFWINAIRKGRVKDVMENLASVAFNRVLSQYEGATPVYAYLDLFPLPNPNAFWPEGGENELSFNITITITLEDTGWLLVVVNTFSVRTTPDEMFVIIDSLVDNILQFYL